LNGLLGFAFFFFNQFVFVNSSSQKVGRRKVNRNGKNSLLHLSQPICVYECPRNAFFVFVFPMYELGELEKLPDKCKEGNKGGQVILKYGEMGPSQVKTHALRWEESLPNTN